MDEALLLAVRDSVVQVQPPVSMVLTVRRHRAALRGGQVAAAGRARPGGEGAAPVNTVLNSSRHRAAVGGEQGAAAGRARLRGAGAATVNAEPSLSRHRAAELLEADGDVQAAGSARLHHAVKTSLKHVLPSLEAPCCAY